MVDAFLGPSDLLNFNNTVVQSDPYGIAGNALGAWKPDMSTWGPVESGVTSFAKSFLQGLLTNYARQDAAEQLSKVVSVLPQLASDPVPVAVPAGVDSGAFNTIKGSSILNRAMMDAQVKQQVSLQEQLATVLGRQKEQEAAGTIRGTLAGYGLGGTQPAAAAPVAVGTNADGTPMVAAVPVKSGAAALPGVPGAELLQDSPQFLQLKRIREEEDAARNELLTGSKYPAIQKFNNTSTALAQLKDIKDLNTASSDIPFATLFIGGLDGSVVREGEYNRVQGANPLLVKFQNQIEGALNGTSTLGVDVKRQMFNELLKTQKGLQAQAILEAGPRLATAQARGANPANIWSPHSMNFDAQYSVQDLKAAGYTDNDIAALSAKGMVK